METQLLKGKTAVITGAGRGIGAAMARLFASHGANVVITDLVFKNPELIEELTGFGARAKAVVLDVCDTNGVNAMIQTVLQEFGAIDIWVNNAGISQNEDIESITPELWDRMLNINLKAVFFCSQAIFKVMKAQNHGKIINLASMAGERGGRGSSASYSASKAGVIVLSKCFALNGGKYNINVNTICPGLILTDMVTETRMSWLDKDNNIPLVRFGLAEDVAKAALFYASDLSDYVTGDTVDVNGGLLMR